MGRNREKTWFESKFHESNNFRTFSLKKTQNKNEILSIFIKLQLNFMCILSCIFMYKSIYYSVRSVASNRSAHTCLMADEQTLLLDSSEVRGGGERLARRIPLCKGHF